MLRYAMPCYAFEFPTFPTLCVLYHYVFVCEVTECVYVCGCVLHVSPLHGYCCYCSWCIFFSSRFPTLPSYHLFTHHGCTTVNTITFNICFVYMCTLCSLLCMHHLQFSLTEERCCVDNINNYLMNNKTTMTIAHAHICKTQKLASIHIFIQNS